MKICHLVFSFPVGGIENLLIDIANEESTTCEVVIMIINNSYNLEALKRISQNVQIVFINRPEGNKWNFIYLLKLWYFLFLLNPDIIHTHFSKTVLFIFPFKAKCVVTIHQVGEPLKYLRLYKEIFSISKAVKSDIKKRRGFDSILIYNGIRFGDFLRRTNYELSTNTQFRLIQIGRLVHSQKGQDVLIKAVNLITKDFGIKNIYVDIIGDGTSKDYLKNQIKKYQLESNITIKGYKDRSWIFENLSSYHCLVQPSRSEGFGLTLVEAVAAGIPVIASNIDGPAEILKGIPSAFLFEDQNDKDLSEKIANLISMYYDESLEAKCQSSYVIMKDNFNIKKTVENYLKCYMLLNEE